QGITKVCVLTIRFGERFSQAREVDDTWPTNQFTDGVDWGGRNAQTDFTRVFIEVFRRPVVWVILRGKLSTVKKNFRRNSQMITEIGVPVWQL
ncbi:MAG: hypothetical protein WBM04_19460, partial [Candidatus Korobacteraceae bacterium]